MMKDASRKARWTAACAARAALFAVALAAGAVAARAADYPAESAGGAPQGGVPCSIGQPAWVPSLATAATLPWGSVYYGHFSGGREYVDQYGRTIVDWRDEHLCFPSRAECRNWVKSSWRAFHEPEGYRGCLMLR